jgi:uncharacterized membrane protein HdeD (DUF308 family)
MSLPMKPGSHEIVVAFALGGVVSLVIGILLLVWPSRTLEVVAILAGISLLLSGAIQIGLAFGEPSGSRAGALLRGHSLGSPTS